MKNLKTVSIFSIITLFASLSAVSSVAVAKTTMSKQGISCEATQRGLRCKATGSPLVLAYNGASSYIVETICQQSARGNRCRISTDNGVTSNVNHWAVLNNQASCKNSARGTRCSIG